MAAAAADLRERIRAIPGMDCLLAALDGLPPAYLVGGAVRDLLRGDRSLDLDLALEGDALAAAQELAVRLGGRATPHERFGTATVHAPHLVFDLAATRREVYERPGALPRVEPAPLAEDLGRRDFTINAMAAALSGDQLGSLLDPHGGERDLEQRAIRVLHDQSFRDDPTRILRAVRYEARLGFAMEPDTERLAREAVAEGALQTVSTPRLGDALILLLGETEAARAVDRLRDLGITAALHPALEGDGELVAGAELGALETGADRALAGLAALVSADPVALLPWLEALGLDADRRGAVARAARTGPLLARELRRPLRPSELRTLLRGEPPEALALALALGAPAEPVLRWAGELSRVQLEIDGRDLLDAGVPEGPAVGAALEETLRRKLDGEVSGREEELQLALQVAAEGA
jgi:tRNA nucleotidyltransferase (CCA-adding enzyme)